MSLMGMREKMNKFSKPIMIGMGVIMLGGAVFNGLGRNAPIASSKSEAPEDDTPLAKVGELSVSRRLLEMRVEQQLQMYKMYGLPQPGAETMDNYRLQALESIKSDQALVAAAKTAGVSVSDSELKTGIEEAWTTGLRPQIAQALKLDPKATDRDIQAALEKEQPGATIERLKEAYINTEAVRQKLYRDGLKKSVRAKLNVNEETVKQGLSKYKVRHILINFGGTTKRTEAEAKAKAEALLAQVKADPKKMADLAKQNSDDPGSKDKGGLYEWKKEELARLVPEFKAAVEKLKVGETYPEVVKHTGGYSGFHIIRLDDIGLPDDFAKEKQKYLDEATEKDVETKITELVKVEEPKVTMTLLDPGLKAAQFVREAQGTAGKFDEKKLSDALAELGKIKKEDDRLGVVPIRKAQILEFLKKDKEALAAYDEALKTNGNKVETRLKIAQLYQKLGEKPKVAEQLAEAEKLAIGDPAVWMQVANLYTQIGDSAGSRRAIEKNQMLVKRKQELEAQEAAKLKAAQAAAPTPEPKK